MLSVIIPFKSDDAERLDAFWFVLAYLIAHFQDAEIIVAEQDTVTEVPKDVRRIAVQAGTGMNRSKCLNAGVAASKGDLLLLNDADMLLPPKVVLGLASDFPEGDALVIPVWMRLCLNPSASQSLYRQDPARLDLDTVLRVERENGHMNNSGGSCGCQMIRRGFYDAVGGHDESYVGWGGEAYNFLERCRIAGRRIQPMANRGVHLYHPRSEAARKPIMNRLANITRTIP